MGLYSKKLNIKKPNGIIQTANLYTDKADVGNNYLTFKDNGNTVYSILDVNGDVDFNVKYNNNLYKIKNANFTMPNYKVIPLNDHHYYDYFTSPNGVNVIFALFDWDADSEKSVEEHLKEKLKTNGGIYIKVTPNKTYGVYNNSKAALDSGGFELSYGIGNFRQQINHGTVFNDPDYYEESSSPVIIAWSNEINQRITTNSAD